MSSPKHKGTGCGLIDLPLRASHEIRPVLVLSLRERPRLLRLRASMILPSQLAFPLLEGHPCWSTCGRRTRPFSGRAFREHRTNVGVLPIPTLDGAGLG